MVRLGSKLLLQSVLQQYRDDASDGAEQESLEQVIQLFHCYVCLNYLC